MVQALAVPITNPNWPHCLCLHQCPQRMAHSACLELGTHMDITTACAAWGKYTVDYKRLFSYVIVLLGGAQVWGELLPKY